MASLHMVKIIEKKRNGQSLSKNEINYFVKSVALMGIPQDDLFVEPAHPCQIGAMLMAFYLNGLNDEETSTLTHAMKNSGCVFSWPPEWKNLVVDKHSTGGVGDKVSLVLAPALAAVGLKVPMISGRSLAHTGGTLDKLESIPGFQVERSRNEIYKQVEQVGCCIVGQTQDIVPADKELYRYRDITATVDNLQLCTASIVSKKLAENVNALVYDVKFGKGSNFKSEENAFDMAKKLVSASREVKCSALLTRMDCPLGNKIGNSLEVLESLECLQGNGPSDLLELVEELGGELLSLATNITNTEAATKIRLVLKNGEALKKFHAMLKFQGVADDIADELCYGNADNVLRSGKFITKLEYTGPAGFVSRLDALVLGSIWKEMTSINSNYASGFTILKHVSDEINSGDIWLHIHHENQYLTQEQEECLQNALSVSPVLQSDRKRVYKRISFNDGNFPITEKVPIKR